MAEVALAHTICAWFVLLSCCTFSGQDGYAAQVNGQPSVLGKGGHVGAYWQGPSTEFLWGSINYNFVVDSDHYTRRMPPKRQLPSIFQPGRHNLVRVYDPSTGTEYYLDDQPQQPEQHSDAAPCSSPRQNSNAAAEEQAGNVGHDDDWCDYAPSPSQTAGQGTFACPVFSSHAAAPCFWVSNDRSEAHFLLKDPGFSGNTNSSTNEQPFGFGTLRFIRFIDKEVLVGWCSTPSCPNKTDLGSILEGKHYESVRAEEFLGSECTLCTCLQQLLNDLGGEDQVKQLLAVHIQQRQPPFSVEHHVNNKQYHIVQLNESYTSLGLVKRWGNKWLCQICPRHKEYCLHLNFMRHGDEDIEAVPWQGGADFEKALGKAFDFSSGQRKLTCISRQPLPIEIEDDPYLLDLYQARARGEDPIPSTFTPIVCWSSNSVPCPGCGQVNWSRPYIPTGRKPCWLFLPATAVQVTFTEARCGTTGCDYVACVDGREYGILWYSEEYAFAHELHIWWGDATESHGVPFYTFWRDTITRYKGFPLTLLRQFFHNVLKKFGLACMDWVQLQGIDWEKAFQCIHGGKHIMVDALTLAFRLKHAHITHPWYAPRHNTTPLVWGSEFSLRVFVRDSKLRKALVDFSSGDVERALSVDEHLTLVEKLAAAAPDQEGLLLQFVQPCVTVAGGKVAALASNREIVFCLATDSPVAQLLKPAVNGLVQKLLDSTNAILPKSDQDVLLDTCPVLFSFLKPFFGHPLPEHVSALLAGMQHVAQRAFLCQGDRGFSGDRTQPVSRAHAAFLEAEGRAANPLVWSHEEAFLRTCTWGGPTQQPWQPSALGGSDVIRSLPLFGADCVSGRSNRRSCTKHKDQNKSLLPGLMLFWCRECSICMFFQVMPKAESPATKFDAIYTRWMDAPEDSCYDNQCNFFEYACNRHPALCKNMQLTIDHAHFRTHTDCNLAYDSKRYRKIKNSPLPEQKNRVLRRLESHMVNMNQPTFMWYVRYFLFRQNRLQRLKNAGKSMIQRPWLAHRAQAA